MIPFQNLTVRAAGDLLADLAACRQLRHLTDMDRDLVVSEAFNPNRAQYRYPREIVPGLVCSQCKRPKSKWGGGELCQACYRNNGSERIVWLSDAFKIAFYHYGYSCDCCPAMVEVSDTDARRAADRALDNLDGKVRLMLCKRCSIKFKAFSQREFGREARSRFDTELEKIMVAFVASETERVAKRVWRSQYAERA